jgi:malonate decarboxylase alpha subunit
MEKRREAIAAVAGVTSVGLSHNSKKTDELRSEGLIAFPEDLHIRRTDAKRSLLAAKNVEEIVEWSDGLYEPPGKFRSW